MNLQRHRSTLMLDVYFWPSNRFLLMPLLFEDEAYVESRVEMKPSNSLRPRIERAGGRKNMIEICITLQAHFQSYYWHYNWL